MLVTITSCNVLQCLCGITKAQIYKCMWCVFCAVEISKHTYSNVLEIQLHAFTRRLSPRQGGKCLFCI